jgi:glyoxylase-like metal-dependent hydrolase (beta-lactamase superfamily II)
MSIDKIPLVPGATVEAFFDPATWTVSYLVADTVEGRAAIIDPVLDFDPKSGRTSTTSADRVLARVREQHLTVDWILETHAHADHLSAAAYLRSQVGGRVAIGQQIRLVQKTFKQLFNLEHAFLVDGSQFDHLFEDGEAFSIGRIQAQALDVPGHTPADMAYKMADMVFVGDTLFMPDVGTARADFPGGDVQALYTSIQRLLALPAETRLYMCHDYPPAGRAACWTSTVADQKAHNIHVNDGMTESAFVQMRRARDATLDMPNLLLPSVQVNVRAGGMPPAEDNGVSYLKLPINAL